MSNAEIAAELTKQINIDLESHLVETGIRDATKRNWNGLTDTATKEINKEFGEIAEYFDGISEMSAILCSNYYYETGKLNQKEYPIKLDEYIKHVSKHMKLSEKTYVEVRCVLINIVLDMIKASEL